MRKLGYWWSLWVLLFLPAVSVAADSAMSDVMGAVSGKPASAKAASAQAAPTKADHYEGIEIVVNINTASSEELATSLIGVGKTRADEIVAYREANGEFASADELQQVKGIGPATVEKNRTRIRL